MWALWLEKHAGKPSYIVGWAELRYLKFFNCSTWTHPLRTSTLPFEKTVLSPLFLNFSLLLQFHKSVRIMLEMNGVMRLSIRIWTIVSLLEEEGRTWHLSIWSAKVRTYDSIIYMGKSWTIYIWVEKQKWEYLVFQYLRKSVLPNDSSVKLKSLGEGNASNEPCSLNKCCRQLLCWTNCLVRFSPLTNTFVWSP